MVTVCPDELPRFFRVDHVSVVLSVEGPQVAAAVGVVREVKPVRDEEGDVGGKVDVLAQPWSCSRCPRLTRAMRASPWVITYWSGLRLPGASTVW